MDSYDTLRQKQYSPIPPDIQRKLTNKSIFMVVDKKIEYQEVILHEESAELCASKIQSSGRYKFSCIHCERGEVLKLVKGLNKRIMKLFRRIASDHLTANDKIIVVLTQTEHDQTLKIAMARAQTGNIMFNPENIQFMVKELKHMGPVLSLKGIKKNDSKVEAMFNIKSPLGKKKKSLHEGPMLGMS